MKYSFAAKALVFTLFVLLTAFTALSGFALVMMADQGFYDEPIDPKIESYLYSILASDTVEMANRYYWVTDYEGGPYRQDGTNFYFTITDADGNYLYGTEPVTVKDFEESYEMPFGEHSDEQKIIIGYLDTDLGENDKYSLVNDLCRTLHKYRYTLIVLLIAEALFTIFAYIFLLCGAGWRIDSEGKKVIALNLIDRIPFDLYIAALVFLVTLAFAFLFDIVRYWSTLPFLAAVALLCLCAIIAFAAFSMTFATRLKVGKWWKNTVIFFVLHLLLRLLRLIGRGILSFFRMLPVVWKAALFVMGFVFVEFLALLNCYSTGDFIPFWLITRLFFFLLTVFVAFHMMRLQNGAKRMSEGDTTFRINTALMFHDFKKHGHYLNNIGKGMTLSVNEMMKSERTKTELITNVSHDIKTPLTSIINYVDLLKREDIDSEQAKEYLNILSTHSAKLKKLIEDLIEASKASTGNIKVDAAPCEIGVLLSQAAGEYAEAPAEHNVEAIVSRPEQEITVLADGRLLWRVFDNLLANICKYSLPNTRAYLSLERIERAAVITFKNISASPLNISASELTERFVRGDSSRSSEGHGLGLSIAKSLTELQGGRLDIAIDGDLFKVSIFFPLIGEVCEAFRDNTPND